MDNIALGYFNGYNMEKYEKLEYNNYKFIFIIDPLPENLCGKNDLSSYSDSLSRHYFIMRYYIGCGYKTTRVPFDTVEKRVEFILNYINEHQ